MFVCAGTICMACYVEVSSFNKKHRRTEWGYPDAVVRMHFLILGGGVSNIRNCTEEGEPNWVVLVVG